MNEQIEPTEDDMVDAAIAVIKNREIENSTYVDKLQENHDDIYLGIQALVDHIETLQFDQQILLGIIKKLRAKGVDND